VDFKEIPKVEITPDDMIGHLSVFHPKWGTGPSMLLCIDLCSSYRLNWALVYLLMGMKSDWFNALECKKLDFFALGKPAMSFRGAMRNGVEWVLELESTSKLGELEIPLLDEYKRLLKLTLEAPPRTAIPKSIPRSYHPIVPSRLRSTLDIVPPRNGKPVGWSSGAQRVRDIKDSVDEPDEAEAPFSDPPIAKFLPGIPKIWRKRLKVVGGVSSALLSGYFLVELIAPGFIPSSVISGGKHMLKLMVELFN
jgi:hypothetical protein